MKSSFNPEALRRDLRHGCGEHLKRRRGIVGLCFFSCAVLGTIALYQVGILKRLPEPRGKAFDTAKVNGSDQAYATLQIPDALLGLGSYAISAGLAGMGPEDRSRTNSWMAVAMGLKLLADAAVAGKLTLDEIRKFKAFSVWSLAAAVASWTALSLAFPETRAALKQWRLHDKF